jgi:hypothetical protein
MLDPDSFGHSLQRRWSLAVRIALFAVGALIFGLSGLCTTALLIIGGPPPDLDSYLIIGLFGGIPMLIGAALIYAAWRRK